MWTSNSARGAFILAGTMILSACQDSGEVGVFGNAGDGDQSRLDGSSGDGDARDDANVEPGEGGASPGGMCPSARVVAVRERPTLWWVVTNYTLTASGWILDDQNVHVSEILDRLLLGEDGVFATLQGALNIGAVMFDQATPCAAEATSTVQPAAANTKAIRDAFDTFRKVGNNGTFGQGALNLLTGKHLESSTRTTPTYVLWMVENWLHMDCTGTYPEAPPAWLDANAHALAKDKPLFDALAAAKQHADKIYVFMQGVSSRPSDFPDGSYIKRRDDELAAMGGTDKAYGHGLNAANMFEIRDALRQELSKLVSCSVTPATASCSSDFHHKYASAFEGM